MTAAPGAPSRFEVAEGTRRLLARWLFSPLQGVRFGDWVRVLKENDFDVGLPYLPRAMFTTLTSVMNSLVARREARRFGPEVAAAQVRRPVFVLGHHRSGTTHLWNLLTTDARFAYPSVLQATFPHTLLTFEGLARRFALRLTMRQRPQDRVPLHPDGPVEEEKAICAATFLSIQMARHFPHHRGRFARYLTLRDSTPAERDRWKAALETFAKKLLIRHGAEKTLVFKAPDHTGKIRLLLELFPDARFVHIHRDPYTVFSSTRHMERTTQPLFAYQLLDRERLDDFVLWRYRAMYDAFFEDLPRIPPGQFAEVAYADLVADPRGVMEGLYTTLGLPDFEVTRPRLEAYLGDVRAYRTNRYVTLAEPLRTRVASAWAPAFARWGYRV